MRNLRNGLAAVAVAAGLGAGALCLPATPALATDSGATQPMYRLYNPNSGEHFYTKNGAERDMLVRLGWRSEGTGWTAPTKSDTPVYRLYNPNAGDHHYTTSLAEKNHLVSVGWRYEGIGWYSSDTKAVPLYRQYNPNAKAGAHNYTTSKGESDHLVQVGWRYEGIAWYGVDTSKAAGETVTAQGQFGEGCTWTLYGDGKLEISPTDGKTGTMANLWETFVFSLEDSSQTLIDLSKVTSIVIDKGVKAPVDSNRLFSSDDGYINVAYFSSLKSIDVSNLDVSDVEDATAMFEDCSSLTGIIGLDKWDTGNFKNMGGMFYGCSSLSDLTPLSGWDVSNVTVMANEFEGCSSLTDLAPLSAWNVSNVTDMRGMFYRCTLLSDATPLNFWNLSSSGTEVSGMFEGCAAGIKTPTWYQG